MQVLYMGRAPRTKETLPDFCEKCRVTRHSRVFRGLTGSQRTPGFGASHLHRWKAFRRGRDCKEGQHVALINLFFFEVLRTNYF